LLFFVLQVANNAAVEVSPCLKLADNGAFVDAQVCSSHYLLLYCETEILFYLFFIQGRIGTLYFFDCYFPFLCNRR